MITYCLISVIEMTREFKTFYEWWWKHEKNLLHVSVNSHKQFSASKSTSNDTSDRVYFLRTGGMNSFSWDRIFIETKKQSNQNCKVKKLIKTERIFFSKSSKCLRRLSMALWMRWMKKEQNLIGAGVAQSSSCHLKSI